MSKTFPLRRFTFRPMWRSFNINGVWQERWIVACPSPGDGYEAFEMAPVFKSADAANEVADNATVGEDFFTSIPCVPFGSPYPRDPRTLFHPGAPTQPEPGKCPKCGR